MKTQPPWRRFRSINAASSYFLSLSLHAHAKNRPYSGLWCSVSTKQLARHGLSEQYSGQKQKLMLADEARKRRSWVEAAKTLPNFQSLKYEILLLYLGIGPRGKFDLYDLKKCYLWVREVCIKRQLHLLYALATPLNELNRLQDCSISGLCLLDVRMPYSALRKLNNKYNQAGHWYR